MYMTGWRRNWKSMNRKFLDLLGLCRRAGKLSGGHDAAFGAIQHGKAAACFLTADASERLKAEFEFILKHFRQGKAVYYHCAWGADRTGFFTLLLEGILGVELDQIYKDYELTSFSAAPGATNRLKTSFQDRIDVIQAYSGATLRDKFEKYFRNSLGVSQEDIDYFRQVMLDSQETVGISQPSTIHHSSSTIYDLQGRRLTSPTRPGLYIVNGKKIAF